ncbi:hypothetical protein PInf_024493 [Phytophthora infestans]|nr:hypothetical protein PInf_024444 [Phytophthora infestans]KAI9988219.1 hypothetical protein PInf_024493 [Phytophthora infestans]
MWNDTGAKTTIWKPFVRLTDDVWVNTQRIEWFGAPHVLSRNPTFIRVIREEQSLRKQAPGGRLLPTRLIDAARQIDPDIGLYDALPGQITPGWSAVTFALDASVDEFEHLHPLVDPQQNTLAITIGIVSPPPQLRRIVSKARRIWAGTVGQFGASEWFIHPQSDGIQNQGPTLGKHPYFEWYTPLSDPGAFPLWWGRVRQQLDRLDLAIYSAPMGWRRYPTMTTRSVTWAEAMSYTKRGARLLHNQLCLGIWKTLREYWKISCKRCNTEIRRRRRKTLYKAVNAGIVSRRKKWAKKTKERVTHAISTRMRIFDPGADGGPTTGDID